MQHKIIPSIIAKDQLELKGYLNRLNGVSKIIHLDIVDGKFAPNHSLHFYFKLKKSFHYQAHLMVENPVKWFEKQGRRMQTIIFQVESLPKERIPPFIKKIKKSKKKAGIAILPETKVRSVEKYLPLVDYVLILTVHPGFYGGKYLPAQLKKIKQIKNITPSVKVIVDGGMSPKTIGKAAQAGADYFISGSYTTKATHPKERIKRLEKELLDH